MGKPDLTASDYQALGEFRYQIRRFLHFSEEAAQADGLEPQQHQLLLAIRATRDPAGPTIGQLAERLLIRHHSAVGLVDRLVERGLVERTKSKQDKRTVLVHLTPQGEAHLRHLSAVHREELRQMAPVLVQALFELLQGKGEDDASNRAER